MDATATIILAIAVLALVAAMIYVVTRLRRSPPQHRSPLANTGRRRDDPLAGAVADHAAATDPHEVDIAERNLRAEANRRAAQAHRKAAAEHEHAMRALSNGHGTYPSDAPGPRVS